MASNNSYIVVLVYPNCRMRNGDNGVTFECEDLILLLRIERVNTLSDLKSLILSKLGGTKVREIGRVAYRLLASMDNGVFRFRLFRLQGDEHVRLIFDIHWKIMVKQVMELSAEMGHSGGGGGLVHSTYLQDGQLLAPPPIIHVAIPVDEAEEGEEESDEDYVADSADSDSFDGGGDENEFVPETSVQTVARYVLSPPHPIPTLLAVPSHYYSLNLDAIKNN